MKKRILFALLLSSCGSLHDNYIRNLSKPYVECGHSLHWNTGNLDGVTTYSLGQDDATLNLWSGSIKNHKKFNEVSRNILDLSLSPEERKMCEQIQHKIMGINPESTDHEISQQFSKNNIVNAPGHGNNFREVQEGTVGIINKTYQTISGVNFTNELRFVASVDCSEKWQIKNDGRIENAYKFKQPDEKCYFFMAEHQLELASGLKVKLAFQGSYEKDAKDPENSLMINIDRFGYRQLTDSDKQ